MNRARIGRVPEVILPFKVALSQVEAETGVVTAKKLKSITTLNIKPTDNFILFFILFLTA